MKICVYGAAGAHIDGIYIEKTEELGKKLASRGHSLVFGAGGTGVMGASARGAKRAGGFVHGVVPTFFKEQGVEQLFEECDKTTYTETMRERKAIMEETADAFIVAPGGVGTLEEFYEALTLKQLGLLDKAIVLLDINGYYAGLHRFMESAAKQKFISESCLNLYKVVTDIDDALDYVESYVPRGISVKKTKPAD